MRKSDILHESRLVDLPDEELKETLGYLWEGIKTLREQEKNDPNVEQMKASLKAYITDNFTTQRKELEKRLKAARAVAKMRGIRWKSPEDSK